ncbi:MAG: glycerol-3-phosphate 1-O-acyltransferase PlsY [Dehalococcoidia bacterium]
MNQQMLLLIVPITYLIGSIPVGLIIGKVKSGIDIRKHGSQSTGATNALRILGTKSAILVLVLDFLKGAIPIFCIMLINEINSNNAILISICGIAIIFGHNWPIFAGFKGGKGVASAVGIAAVLNPLSALAAILTFLPILFTTKYVSLGSIFGAIVAMIILIVQSISEINDYSYIYALVVGPLLVIKHHENIRRLINGNERKFGEKV